MTPESEFITGMRRLRRFINNRNRIHMLTALTTAALGLNLLAVAAQKAGWFSWNGLWGYGVITLAAAVAVWGYHRKTRRNFLHVLIDMDERLRLKDLLSTTYTVHYRREASPFMDRLLLDANRCLKRIAPGTVYPLKFSFLHALILIFTTALIITAGYDFPDAPMEQPTGDIRVMGPKVQTLSPLELSLPEEWTDTAPETVYRQLESMAHAVESGAMSRQEMAEAVSGLSDEVRIHRERMADQLSEALMGYGFPEAVDGDSPAGESMEQLKKEIREYFREPIPESVKQSLSELEKIENALQRLEEVSEEMPAGAEVEESEALVPQTENPLDAQNGESAGDSPDSAVGGSSHDAARFMIREEQDRLPGGAGRPGASAEADAGRTTEGDGKARAAGVAEAVGKKKTASQIESAQGPSFSTKSNTSAAPRYEIPVRAHPSSGKAELTPKSIYRAYRQEMESVLNTEEIPLNYRQYIKNYFISIGLRKDSDDDASQ